MRIVQRTSTQLVVHHSPHGIWVIGGFLFTVGISVFSIPVIISSEHLSKQIYAYVFIVLGIFTLLSSGQIITWTFDKSDSSLLVQSRGLFGIRKSEHTLMDISEVRVTSKSNDGTSTFGIELMLKTGERLELCPGFMLSEVTAKEGIRRISSFLELRQ